MTESVYPDRDESMAIRSEAAVSHPREREALVLLATAGWSTAELAMTFQCDEKAVRRVVKQRIPGFYE